MQPCAFDFDQQNERITSEYHNPKIKQHARSKNIFLLISKGTPFNLVQFGVLVKLKENLLYVRSESGIWFTGTDAEVATEHCQQVTSWSMKGLTDNLVPKEVMAFNDGYTDQANNRFFRMKINLRYNSAKKVYESYLKVTPYHGRIERDMLDGEKPYAYITTVKKRTSHRKGSRLNAQVAPM